MRPLTAVSRPGSCSRCRQWLGSTADPICTPARCCGVPTEYQLWLADAIGELLASAPRIEPERLRTSAREALLAYANAFTEGNRTAVADMAGCGRGVFYSWFKGDNAPRIDILLRTWYRLKLPVAYVFENPYPGFFPQAQSERSSEIRYAREKSPKRTPEQTRRALEAALQEQPPPALHEIAQRLGYGTTTRLRSVDKDLCRQIVLMHLRSGRSHWWRKRGAKPICELSRLKTILEGYLASENPVPPLDRIARSLGYAVDTSMWEKFPELCPGIAPGVSEPANQSDSASDNATCARLRERRRRYRDRGIRKRTTARARSLRQGRHIRLQYRLV